MAETEFTRTVGSMAGLTSARGPQHPWWALALGVEKLMKSKKAEDIAAVSVIERVFTEAVNRK